MLSLLCRNMSEKYIHIKQVIKYQRNIEAVSWNITAHGAYKVTVTRIKKRLKEHQGRINLLGLVGILS